MARPNKFDLKYFPLDVTFFDDHKIISIEEEFGVKGGYVAIRIMSMVYSDKGYYLEWPDKFEYSVAKRVGNNCTGTLVGEIFQCCLKNGLFSKEIFEKYSVVTSRGIQKRWLEVMGQMRRKTEVNVDYWLVSSEETSVFVHNSMVSSESSTQKEIKVKEIKEELETKVSVEVPSPPVDLKIELEKQWKALEKTKDNVYLFIHDIKPRLVEPYVEFWNLFANEYSLTKVSKITETRKKKLLKRLDEKEFDFIDIIRKAKKSEFLMVKWKGFGFDWIIVNESNYLKIIEGSYSNGKEISSPENYTEPKPMIL